MNVITRVRVDSIGIENLNTVTPSVSFHFNCFGANDEPLPGLGGRINNAILEKNSAWHSQVDTFIATLIPKAKALVAEFDPYDSVEIQVIAIQLKRYRDGGQGINIVFRRDDDPFHSCLLFEYKRPPYEHLRINQKLDVTDEKVAYAVDARITQIMEAADALALQINRGRNIQRKERVNVPKS